MQTPLASTDIPASTRFVADKGPNIPRQDVPNTTLEPGDTPPLITKLSP